MNFDIIVLGMDKKGRLGYYPAYFTEDGYNISSSSTRDSSEIKLRLESFFNDNNIRSRG